jgi:hypothetical protein
MGCSEWNLRDVLAVCSLLFNSNYAPPAFPPPPVARPWRLALRKHILAESRVFWPATQNYRDSAASPGKRGQYEEITPLNIVSRDDRIFRLAEMSPIASLLAVEPQRLRVAPRQIRQKQRSRQISSPTVNERRQGWEVAEGLPCAAQAGMPRAAYRWRLAGRQNEAAGTRTQDLRIKSPLLYRLSYSLEVVVGRAWMHPRVIRGGTTAPGKTSGQPGQRQERVPKVSARL